MLSEDRVNLIKKLNRLEDQFPVHLWIIGGLHIWPILKNEIFFSEFGKPNVKNPLFKMSRVKETAKLIKRCIFAQVQLFSLKTTRSSFLFAGAPSHRAEWKGKSLNKFFDPMIQFLGEKNITSTFTEYQPIKKKPIYSRKNYIDCSELVYAFRANRNFVKDYKKLLTTTEFQKFLNVLGTFFPDYNNDLSKSLFPVLNKTLDWRDLYLFLFKRIQPNYAAGLCYYSEAMYGMNSAAAELGIISIDMQHGTTGLLHPSYFFKRVPEHGYNVLPKIFWCWDESSVNNISAWSKNKCHQAVLIGNPWFSFLKEQEGDDILSIPTDKPLILFTHQPLTPVLDNYLIECVKRTKKSYNWWIRLHPRITNNDAKELKSILDDNNLSQYVELLQASQLPLPLLLSKTSVHISKYSGSILESVMSGIPTIVLEGIGNTTYSNYIDEGKAIGIAVPTVENLTINLELILNTTKTENTFIDYKEVLVDYIN